MKRVLCLLLSIFPLFVFAYEPIEVECYIDEESLVSSFLFANSKRQGLEDFKAFQEQLVETYPGEYNFFFYESHARAPQEFVNIVKNLPTYKKLFSETEEFMKKCENEWHTNQTVSTKIIEEITGLRMQEKKSIRVPIKHPKLNSWSKGTNGFTCYVWKEILSTYLDTDCISQALVTLSCDYELALKLQGETFLSLQEKLEKRSVKALEEEWLKNRTSEKLDIVNLAASLKRQYGLSKKAERQYLSVIELAGGRASPLYPEEYVKLNFVIDERRLVGSLLLEDWTNFSERYQTQVRAFQEYMWKKKRKECFLLADAFLPKEFSLPGQFGTCRVLRKLIRAAKEFPLYSQLRHETEERLEFCCSQWEKNYQTTFAMMKELTGIPFQDVFTVYINHPGLRGGANYQTGEIFWGGQEHFENYTTVYMWHEVMHSYWPEKQNPLTHAIQELICDNEMQFRLSRAPYPPTIGHPYLDALREKIVPEWKEYLLLPKKDLYQFHKKIEANIKNE
jgi:hypothetical protein